MTKYYQFILIKNPSYTAYSTCQFQYQAAYHLAFTVFYQHVFDTFKSQVLLNLMMPLDSQTQESS